MYRAWRRANQARECVRRLRQALVRLDRTRPRIRYSERMEITDWVGFAAGFLTTIAFVPQVTKIWKSRSARDISTRTFLAFTLGVFLWLTYGILMGEAPMILWNSVTLVLAGSILAMKRRFG